MGGLSFNGMDKLELSFEELATLDDETRRGLLCAGAEAVLEYLRRYLHAHHHRTGGLEESLRAELVGDTALVGPRGKISRRGKRKILHRVFGSGGMKRSKHHGAAGGITYPELGFLLEFGTPRMKATHWMENANEQSADDVTAAMFQAWDKHLKDLNL